MDSRKLNLWFRKKLDYKGPDIDKFEGMIDSFNICVWSDPPANRIRIHAEICDADDIDHKEILNANFHSTQDVHYAIQEGKVYAVFTHWFSELTEFELDEALTQILDLATNTLLGVYESGDMVLYSAYQDAQKEKVTVEKLEREWDICCRESDPIQKGRVFEDFVNSFLSLEPGLRKIIPNFRTKNEEIDIIIKNKVQSSTWKKYNSSIIMVECKNTENKVPAKEVRNFLGKIENHKNLCTLGFFFSVNGFEKGCMIELVGLRKGQIKLTLIEGKDINKFFKGPKSLKEFLEDSLIASMK